ncbi:Zinc finger CCHC-type [Arabidopsis suecica]|uniref:Zinc finger CCHC-type n=1 Tax=Arabidopsis suecica TaxID=45249 RepID=A0A8T2AH22_ARASU|nr:Zinc finger CCHC-type [Arabidopsis suecica]
MEILSLPFKKRFSWNKGNRSLHGLRANGKREELGTSSKDIQCFECKGFGHVRLECANLLKPKKKKIIMNNSETDSDDGEELKSFVAFTTFESTSVVGGVSTSVSGSASASASGAVIESDNDQSDDDAASISDEEFHENYKALYEHWLKMTDKCGLGFDGKLLKSDPVFVSSGKITSGSGSVSETVTVAETASGTRTTTRTGSETASALRKNPELKKVPQRIFRPVCHHCGVVGHIRPRCFKLLRERNRMENAYDVRFHGPTCYHCGVQGHIKRNCFRFVRESSHVGLRRRKIWVRKDDLHGGGVLGYQPRIAKRGEFSK